MIKGHLKRLRKVQKKKLYNWESWEKYRAIASAQAEEAGATQIIDLKSPMRTRTERERSVFRISIDRLPVLNGDEPPKVTVVNTDSSFESSDISSIMTGAGEQPSIVMNELEMMEVPKQPNLKRGNTQGALSRRKTVTIDEDNNTTH